MAKSNYKKFNGIPFRKIEECIETKEAAKEKAKNWRKDDFKARVVKAKCGFNLYIFNDDPF